MTCSMQVKVDAAEIDPQGTRDPAVIRAGDFNVLVRDALRAQFPEVTDRAPAAGCSTGFCRPARPTICASVWSPIRL